MKGRFVMKKIMISQPMKGRTIEQVKGERAEVVKKSQKYGYTVLDTVFWNPIQTDENEAICNLSESIKYIAKADIVYFMKGWEYSRGCLIEHEVAVQYGKKIAYE